MPYWLLALLATVTFAAALTGVAQSPSNNLVAAENTLAAAPFPPVHAPTSFVAVRAAPGQGGLPEVTVDSAATGDVERVVMPAVVDGLSTGATAVDRRGRIWLTLAHGPRSRCQGNATCATGPGGNTVPGTCASAVVRLSPQTGAAKFVLIGSADETLEDAQPSPNGKLLAYVRATCTREGRQYLVVDDLSTGRSWTIGKALPPCHRFDSLAWTPDGAALVLDLRASLGRVGGSARCGTATPNGLAVVPALEPAHGLPGRQVRMRPNCQVNAVTGTATGFAAIEVCGRKQGYPTGATGPASLVRFDSALRVSSRSSIGKCAWTSGELGADPSGSEVLGLVGQHCPTTVTHPWSTMLFTDT
ncbi:MAG: hypothetical protein ACRDYZ_06990, partial [Acidimicrobiales bacterium]